MLYLVSLIDDIDKLELVTSCHTKEELAQFISHLDDRYEVTHIERIPDFVDDYTELLIKDDNLELG